MGETDTGRVPKLWEIYFPTPPCTPEAYKTDERIEKAEKQLHFWKKGGYIFSNVHEMQAKWPEECMFIMREENYYTEMYLAQTFKEYGYLDWFEKQNVTEVYKNCKLFLQFISFYYKPESHWLLKAPYHLMNINTLIQTYSDK